jgi:hypothetical protein
MFGLRIESGDSGLGMPMGPEKVILIRHAEKPNGNGRVLGVEEAGRADATQLSVRGWQRAGALVRYFAPANASVADGIATPSVIFACKPYGAANSVRPLSTVWPLGQMLGIAVNQEIGKHDVPALLEAVKSSSGTVLICWSHKLIACIVRGLAGGMPGLPEEWPANRFDLVWVLDRTGTGWNFYQVGQLLLPGDTGPAEGADCAKDKTHDYGTGRLKRADGIASSILRFQGLPRAASRAKAAIARLLPDR